MKAGLFRGLVIRILRSRWRVKGLMNLLVKSGSRDLNRLDEPKIERETQRRLIGPCAAAASIVHSMKYNTSVSTEC